MTNYTYDYTVDGKYHVFRGTQKKFDAHIYGLMARGYRVMVVSKQKQ